MKQNLMAVVFGVTALLVSFLAHSEDRSMGFFVTSVGMGKGANLGDLAGADAYCKKLATAAGAGERDWKAYLSTKADPDNPRKRGVFARSRIGNGPWYNAHGTLIATNLTDLHLYNKTITLQNAVDENGKQVNGRGSKPNRHDILTGTNPDGTALFGDGKDHTCNDWTSEDPKGSAMVGHHDRHGGGNISWNAAHGSRGCGEKDLPKSGGAGLFYCFAAN
jgi:hypothetical protein